jgi:flavin reductase (DIM6/NTAB) family NADH-FMN oxidoreductase RutF
MMADGGAMMESDFIPNPDTARAYRDALGSFATGVTVITIQGSDGPLGFTANSFSSLSMDPPLVLWSLAKSAGRYAQYAQAQHFAVHVLAAEQSDLIRRFHRSGAGFDALDHDLNPQKVPLLAGALARFECEQYSTHEGGDHLIVVGRVSRVTCQGGAPLVFSKGQFGRFSAAS